MRYLARCSLIAIALLSFPSLLRADAASLDGEWGDADGGRSDALAAWASAAVFGGPVAGSRATLVAPSLGVRLAIHDQFSASATWAFAYGVAQVGGMYEGAVGPEPYEQTLERFEAGNPSLTFAWTPVFGDVALRIGVGAAIPMAALAQAPTDVSSAAQRDASQVIHRAMIAMHGGRDVWRFLPERMAFFIPISVAFGNDTIAGRVEWAMAWTIPVLGGRGSHEAALQGAAELAWLILPELRAGLRFSVSAWGLGEGAPDPRFQPSIEPWVRVLLGDGFLTARGTINLGGSDGFGSADSGTWAIHLGGGMMLR